MAMAINQPKKDAQQQKQKDKCNKPNRCPTYFSNGVYMANERSEIAVGSVMTTKRRNLGPYLQPSNTNLLKQGSDF